MLFRKYTVDDKRCPRILYISDIHEKKIKQDSPVFLAAELLHPDLILFGGDMVSRTTIDFANIEYICKRLHNYANIYACLGNHEQSIPQGGIEILKSIYTRYSVTLLDNARRDIECGKHKISICGITLPYGVYRNEKGGFSGLYEPKVDDITERIGEKPDNFTILLAHNPLYFGIYSQWGAELTLSGHVHGGIIRLPKIGGLLSPERKFLPKYSLGEYKKEGKTMIVSSGIGKFRLFNPADIVYITPNSDK